MFFPYNEKGSTKILPFVIFPFGKSRLHFLDLALGGFLFIFFLISPRIIQAFFKDVKSCLNG